MEMDHELKNTGRRPIVSTVYNHNFLVLDRYVVRGLTFGSVKG